MTRQLAMAIGGAALFGCAVCFLCWVAWEVTQCVWGHKDPHDVFGEAEEVESSHARQKDELDQTESAQAVRSAQAQGHKQEQGSTYREQRFEGKWWPRDEPQESRGQGRTGDSPKEVNPILLCGWTRLDTDRGFQVCIRLIGHQGGHDFI